MSTKEDPASERPADKAESAVPEDAMMYCPVCDQRLISRKCKLLCERCGYYMSCADYY